MPEREHIFNSIKEQLREVPDVAVVTTSLRKAASINEMPSIPLIDLGAWDDIYEYLIIARKDVYNVGTIEIVSA